MQKILINLLLKINDKYFFKKTHPFNIHKNWVLNLNYSDFEYNHTQSLLDMYKKIIDLEPFLREKNILEVWCWWWWKSIYIAEKYNSKLTWIDINDNFLNQAKQKAKEKNISNLTNFLNKSALDTAFKDNSFDLILMSDVIEHIPNTNKLFEEMWRILKKDWLIIFDFAPYYHYFGHHLWDTIQIPWIHLFFSDSFLVKLYKKSIDNLIDKEQRISLRIWSNYYNKEYFDYLNKIKRKDFENITKVFIENNKISDFKIKYYILKDFKFLNRIPFLREVFIRHIVWYLKK